MFNHGIQQANQLQWNAPNICTKKDNGWNEDFIMSLPDALAIVTLLLHYYNVSSFCCYIFLSVTQCHRINKKSIFAKCSSCVCVRGCVEWMLVKLLIFAFNGRFSVGVLIKLNEMTYMRDWVNVIWFGKKK